MAIVRFLDGKQAGRTAQIDDGVVAREGRYYFKKRELAPDGAGRPYYLKQVPQQRWVKAEVIEWTAALDEDADE